MALGWVFLLCSFSYSNAQEYSTEQLIDGSRSAWEGCTTATSGSFWGGNSGGPCPGINEWNQIIFSYGQYTLSQTFNLPSIIPYDILGIQIIGYDYSWMVKNSNINGQQPGEFDPIAYIDVTLFNYNGSIAIRDRYDYGYYLPSWNTFSGSRTYNSPYSLTEVDKIQLSVTSVDSGFWAGYYGPEFNNFNLSVRYSVDPCASDPLYSVSCPGYQAAWELQQYNLACSADPLFDIGCPGFQQTLESQVCAILGPLASLFCPGYADALAFQQACSADATYDPKCPGYGAAMAKKLEDRKKDEPQIDMVQTTTTIEDQTKSESTIDVGGIEMSATGELTVPDDKPEILKESVKEEEKEIDRNLLLSIIRDATDNAEALRVVNQSIEQSLSKDVNPDFTGTEEVLTNIPVLSQLSIEIAMNDNRQEEKLFDEDTEEIKTTQQSSQTTFAEKEEKTEETVKITSFDTTNTNDLGNQIKVEIKESKEEEKTVKKDIKDNDLATGVSINTLTKSSIDLTAYTNQTLNDAQFYKSEEIYKNQFIGDNRRAQRLLNESNDRLYNDLTKDQYKEK